MTALFPRNVVALTALALAILGPRGAGALGSAPASAPAAEASAAVVVSGQVEVRTDAGTFAPLPAGERPPSYKDIRAVSGMTALRFGDARVELAPGAVAVLQGRLEVQGAAGRKPAAKLLLRSGQLVATVPAGSLDQLLVLSGDNLVLVRAGGALAAAAGARSASRALHVVLYGGDAAYSAHGTWKPLTQGEVRRLAAPEPSTTRPTVAAPPWERDAAEASGGALALVTSDDARAPLRLRVGAVPAASGYVVEVARSEAFTETVARCELAAAGPVDTPPLPAGRYVARARALDAVGLPGAAGPTRPLRVLRVKLPPGSAVVGEAFTVPVGVPVVLDDPGGVELRRGKSPFEPAPAELVLDDDAPLRLVLRLVGDTATRSVLLTQRALRADVELGPKTAVWPFDPVTVSVLVHGPKPPGFEPRLTVRVNLAEVDATWRRDGDTWRTELEPRSPPGPWVVRVEAVDPQGGPLGRGFLEVVAASVPPRRR